MTTRWTTRLRPEGGWSVAGTLTGAFAVLVGLLVLVSAAGALGLHATSRAHSAEVQIERLDDANTAMLQAMTDAETGVRGYRLALDAEFLEPYQVGSAAFPAAAAAAREAADDDVERALVDRQVAVAEDWLTTYAVPVAAMEPGGVVVGPEATLRHKRTFDDFLAANAALAERARASAAAAEEAETATRATSTLLIATALVLALVVVVVVHRRTHRALAAPLVAVAGVVQRLTAGERAARADPRRGASEVRLMARTVNDLADEGDRLRRERADAAASREVAVEIGRTVRDELVAGDPVGDALARLGEHLGVERAYLRPLREDRLVAVEREWHLPHLPPLPPAATAALDDAATVEAARRLYLDGGLFTVEDTAAVRGENPGTDALADRTGARAALVVPVGAAARPLGLLTLLVASGPRRWLGHEVGLAAAVAADLGRAVVLGELLGQQRLLVAQLRDLDRRKTDFLAAVSHELRTPLTSISGYVEMVRDGDAGPVSEDVDTMLAVVQRCTARLRALIEDLLTLSSIEARTFRVERSEVVVADLLARVAEQARPAADAAGLALEVRPGEDGVAVSADAAQLQRALGDLMANAVKFTPPGGRVALRAGAADGWLEVAVSDTGIGIPAAEQDAVFSRFFRASNATSGAVQGTGLGLMIARNIVEHHGGELRVVSAEGRGTTVTVRLPLAHALAPAPDERRPADQQAEVVAR